MDGEGIPFLVCCGLFALVIWAGVGVQGCADRQAEHRLACLSWAMENEPADLAHAERAADKLHGIGNSRTKTKALDGLIREICEGREAP